MKADFRPERHIHRGLRADLRSERADFRFMRADLSPEYGSAIWLLENGSIRFN